MYLAPAHCDVPNGGLAEAAGLDQDLTCVVEEVESRLRRHKRCHIKRTSHDNLGYIGIITYNNL